MADEKWDAVFLNQGQLMMTFKYLLAKSIQPGEKVKRAETLVGHTQAVIQAATSFFEVLQDHLIGLIQIDNAQKLWKDLIFACAWLHDLGKANDHFQRMLRETNFEQGIRHETLGLVILYDYFLPWLNKIQQKNNYPEWFSIVILFAVCGHHLKFPDPKTDRKGCDVIFLGSHPDIYSFLQIGLTYFSCLEGPTLTNQTYDLLYTGIPMKLEYIKRMTDHQWSDQESRFIAILKSLLICSDIAGSALPEKIQGKTMPMVDWLKKRIMPVLEKKQLIKIVDQKLKGQAPRPFQNAVLESSANTIILEAGCGAGKTAAAYLWASKHAHNKRLFFCYPTTATASEGFANYLYDSDFESILIHSRMKVDYRLLANLPKPSASQIEFKELQLTALETWPIPAVVCTAHTVLGLLQNAKRGMISLPSIVRSAFVFDEIHSYSNILFQHLLRFISIFNHLPMLLMTATLPKDRKNALMSICENKRSICVIQGPQEREMAPRYQLLQSTKDKAWEKTQHIIANGGKVLWICNTVNALFNILEKARHLPVEPFHSRYRYADRLFRQRKLITEFASSHAPLLAVTTQVAEMSLDLSADLLISEYAPIPSMIQRLGRLNRFDHIPKTIREAVFIPPKNALPYETKKENVTNYFNSINTWLTMVCDGCPKSQKDLANAFQIIAAQHEETTPLFCDWIDEPGISLKNRHSIMEPGHTIDVIRQEDADTYHLEEMVIPMPIPKNLPWQHWQLKKYYPVAPQGTIEYSSFIGGKYAENPNQTWTF